MRRGNPSRASATPLPPGLGTCRYKIDFKKKPEQAAKDMDRLFQIFQAHNIRYFFYIGGNDSQDTSHKIHEEAVKRGYEMRVIGVPKTIDNDLPHTDSCPGYGSVIKYNATTVMEVGIDVGEHGDRRRLLLHHRGHGPIRGLDRRRHGPGQARQPRQPASHCPPSRVHLRRREVPRQGEGDGRRLQILRGGRRGRHQRRGGQ